MENVLGIDLNIKYSERIVLLTNKGIALWDVLQSCQRSGSLDTNIIIEEQNDFESFFTSYNNIKAIFFNGGKAYNLYLNMVLPYLSEDKRKLPMKQLPSTSPANTKVSISKKIEIWKKELHVYFLLRRSFIIITQLSQFISITFSLNHAGRLFTK